MASRDKRWREPKKPKKGAKKTTVPILTPQVAVEVIKRGKEKSTPSEEE